MSPWLITLLVISSAFQLSVCKSTKYTARNDGLCITPDCRNVGAAFTASMDTTIDPCDNFYKYACGRWAANNPKPKFHKGTWNNLARMSLLAQTRLRDELQKNESSTDSSPVKKMKMFYKTCINERKTQTVAINTIKEMLRATNGWPMTMSVNQWDAKFISWQDIEIYYSQLLGNSTFYSITLDGGYQTDYYTLLIQSPVFYPDQYRDRQTYRLLISEVANVIIRENDQVISNTQLQRDIDDLIEFEDKLHKATTTDSEIKKIKNLPKFIKEWNQVTKDFPQTRIDWNAVFERLYEISKVRPSARASVTLRPYNYFIQLGAILQSTNVRTIVNFVQWKFLSKILPHATPKMEELFYRIENNVKDSENKPPRWVYCVDQIGRNYASYSLFIEKYYDQTSRNNAENLYRELLDGMKNQLQNSNWLSSLQKQVFTLKINSVKSILGRSAFYNNEQKLMDYFDDLEIDGNYLVNTLHFITHGWKKRMTYWGKSTDSLEDLDDPLRIHAVYQPLRNTISVRAGLLQPPLLNDMVTNFVRYGTVGSILGHEMSHALNDAYLKTKLNPNELCSYNRIVHCFINNYINYFKTTKSTYGLFIGNPSMRGQKTQEENIADWNGVQVSFQAYKKLIDDRGIGDFKLPGFEEFSDEKMFFLSFAQTWCHETYEDNSNDPHSPAFLRVVGTLSHTSEFAAAFNCPANSTMNPEQKCNMWMKYW